MSVHHLAPRAIAAALTLFAGVSSAHAFTALEEGCSLEVSQPAVLERFVNFKLLHERVLTEMDYEAPADEAAARKAVCGDAGCTAWKAVDVRDGIVIHVVIPDDAGGAWLIRDMGWIGGVSACNLGEPWVKTKGDRLFEITIEEIAGELGGAGEPCEDVRTATSVLVLDLAAQRWLVRGKALSKGDAVKVTADRIEANVCGKSAVGSRADFVAGDVKPGDAPARGAPASADAAWCEQSWGKQVKASTQKTMGCLTHFLTMAYGQAPDAEAMSLDPGYGHAIEVKLTSEMLEKMIHHTAKACDLASAKIASVCNRGNELLVGMHRRRLGLFDDPVMASIEPLLAKVLAGEALTPADLFEGQPMRWSPVMLWKLRNAAYARHGYAFKTADLHTFFYKASKQAETKLLPLRPGNTKKVNLTATDRANVRLIKRFEAGR